MCVSVSVCVCLLVCVCVSVCLLVCVSVYVSVCLCGLSAVSQQSLHLLDGEVDVDKFSVLSFNVGRGTGNFSSSALLFAELLLLLLNFVYGAEKNNF